MVKQFSVFDVKIQSARSEDMAENENDPTQLSAAWNPSIQTENIAFDSEQMVSCGGCLRMNPPNRLNCLYCGGELDIKPEDLDLIKPTYRRPEDWEPGFNVVLISELDPNGPEVEAIARHIGADAACIREIVDTKRPMPIARLASEKESQIIVATLGRSGINCTVMSDASLLSEQPPTRLRAVDFQQDSVTLIEFNTGSSTKIDRDDLVLIVPGMIKETKVDQIEKKLRRKDSKVLEESETSSNETVLDIYVRHDAVGFRVMLTGFDFSCLGDDKGLLASENMRRLATRLHQFAPNAKIISDYASVKHALSDVWEIDRRNDSKGMLRSGFARLDFGKTLSSSNLRQLNKFSRLQWHLL
jgi:hypothetical protein